MTLISAFKLLSHLRKIGLSIRLGTPGKIRLDWPEGKKPSPDTQLDVFESKTSLRYLLEVERHAGREIMEITTRREPDGTEIQTFVFEHGWPERPIRYRQRKKEEAA